VLSLAEYGHVRAEGNHFIVCSRGHEDSSVEEIIERHPTHVVVEKQGVAGAIARSDDSR
jgi:hypothetical protein